MTKNGKIKRIKKSEIETWQEMKQTATNQVLHSETRLGAREIVQNWVNDMRQAKEVQRQNALAFWAS